MLAVLAGNQKKPVKVCMNRSYNPVRGCLLADEESQAVRICTDAHEYELIFRHGDLAGPQDLLQAGSCMGIGSVLVCADSGELFVLHRKLKSIKKQIL